MNIFYLDKSPQKAAELHCNKHVVKMVLEYAQLLSTAHRVLDGTEFTDASSGRRIKRWKVSNADHDEILYKATHMNHPSAVWVRENESHYQYTYELFRHLCDEYTHRYGKIHLTDTKLRDILKSTPVNIQTKRVKQPPQAMPDDVKAMDSVTAYQKYYKKYKHAMAEWTKREIPAFMFINFKTTQH